MTQNLREYHVKELTLEDLMRRLFKSVSFLQQQIVFGSLLTPMQDCEKNLELFHGDFSAVFPDLDRSYDEINLPFFNICIEGNGTLPGTNASFFDGASVFVSYGVELEKRNAELMSFTSLSVRLVKSMLRPLKNVFNSTRGDEGE